MRRTQAYRSRHLLYGCCIHASTRCKYTSTLHMHKMVITYQCATGASAYAQAHSCTHTYPQHSPRRVPARLIAREGAQDGAALDFLPLLHMHKHTRTLPYMHIFASLTAAGPFFSPARLMAREGALGGAAAAFFRLLPAFFGSAVGTVTTRSCLTDLNTCM